MGTVVADIPEGSVGIRNHRRTFIRPHGRDSLTLVRNPSGVGDHHLLRLVRSQILELRQHLLRGPKVEGRLVVRILEALAGHDNPAVDLVLRVQKMNVAGGADRLVKLLSKLHNPLIQINQILAGLHRALLVPQHKFIVAKRLNLQVIIEIHNLVNLGVGTAPKQRLEQFPRLAGRADNQPFPVLVQHAFRDSGPSGVVVQMGHGHQTVEIHPSHIVLRQDDNVVGGQLLDAVRIQGAQLIELIQRAQIPLL